jgi:membrane-associated phospholipid phosphatase
MHRTAYTGRHWDEQVVTKWEWRFLAAEPRHGHIQQHNRHAIPDHTKDIDGFLAVIYAAGRMLERARVRELGLLGIRTLCNTELLGNPLKIATQRPRPTEKGGSGQWEKGGHSFPSGHSMKCWALASLLSQEFPRRRMVGVLAYGVAGIVSLARLFGFRHFASDAFGGAVAGWYIGAMVHRRHRALPDSQRR